MTVQTWPSYGAHRIGPTLNQSATTERRCKLQMEEELNFSNCRVERNVHRRRRHKFTLHVETNTRTEDSTTASNRSSRAIFSIPLAINQFDRLLEIERPIHLVIESQRATGFQTNRIPAGVHRSILCESAPRDGWSLVPNLDFDLKRDIERIMQCGL